MTFRHFPLLLLLLLLIFADSSYGFGSMGPLSASFGDNALFCAIDASGNQAVICWNTSGTASTASHYSAALPPMAALSGGQGFLCGILANTSQALCWDSMNSAKTSDLVPGMFQYNTYSHLAAGKDHVCAIRGSYYSVDDSGAVDCWEIPRVSNNSFTSKQSTLFYTQSRFTNLVSGDGFTCGVTKDGGGVSCFGPNSIDSNQSESYFGLASGTNSICGILQISRSIKCWGNSNNTFDNLPTAIRFVSIAAGAEHYCGIREDNHGVECWGNFNSSLIPKGSGFLSIASSNSLTCGIREGDLVLDCWFANMVSRVDYDPPLQLCSPGLCTAGACGDGMFTFNASLLNEPDLTSLCVRKDVNICSPCGVNCSEGFFPSSVCSPHADRVCTPCSLCQNTSCQSVCRLDQSSSLEKKNWDQFLVIIASSCCGILLILIATWCCLCKRPRKTGPKTDENCDHHQHQHSQLPSAVAPCPGAAQVFRLSELKDATNGFKEFNELGRGSFGFVYKAVLPDGRHVAVKRANAATIIHTNSRDFETELEVLCNVRHVNVVNLLGYCAEMGERILVYELMPHGTLHDHLHGGLSSLNWSLRLKIATQAAKGLAYLHKEVVPPIVHGNVKSSKILLDGDWCGRISDFGLVDADIRMDVYGFGVVLLEILSGRKAYDDQCGTPDIVAWALPQIRQGKGAAIIDRYVALPRNVEPLLKLADIAEVALKEDPNKRASMSDLALLLDQLVKDGLVL